MRQVDESWSAQQLTEFLAFVSGIDDVETATQRGIERAAEALEAEVGAIVRGDEVLAAIGFGNADPPRAELVAAAAGRLRALEVPGVGSCRVLSVALDDERNGQLVLARQGDSEFSRQEGNLVRGLARVLALALRSLRLLADERELRTRSEDQTRENERLLVALGERQVLLERLARIQRAIVDRAVLQDVLDSIVAGAGELLGDDVVALRLVDPDDPDWMVLVASRGMDHRGEPGLERCPISEGIGGRAIGERRLVVSDDYQTEDRALPYFRTRGLRIAMSAPVWENGHVMGSLTVASYRERGAYTDSEREVLLAFAEHASLALTDAKNFDEAVHRSMHDMLTGLPNRALLMDRLGQALRRAERTDALTAVLFLDLDGFKRVNDSLGHPAGDQLLIEVAERLDTCLRPADTAARLGGDEFAILLEGLTGTSDATMVASRVMAALQAPIVLLGRSVTITASIGIAIHRDGEDDLLRNADLAMYRAKSLGKSRYEVFDPAMHAVVVERMRLESELQRAIERGEFTLRYQPIVSLDGAVAGIEALVRWNHPERGLLYPDQFIPTAEETGLISPIGRWVLNEACRQAVRWQSQYPGEAQLAIAVNLSVTQIQQPGLIYEVAEALERSGLDPHSLILEITETLLLDELETTQSTLDGLKRIGVQLAVDDFGTGYSSLQYLRRFPIDILKIAKSFVDGIADGGEFSLARVVVEMGKSLGMEVIAEGIELPEQVASLQQMGCRWGQGYHFARPLDIPAVDRLLAASERIVGWPAATHPPRADVLAAPSAIDGAVPGEQASGPAKSANGGRPHPPADPPRAPGAHRPHGTLAPRG